MQYDGDTPCFSEYSVEPLAAVRDLTDEGVALRMLERQIAELEQRARRTSKQHGELETLREQAVLLKARTETTRRALQLQQQLRQPTSVPAYLGQPGDY